MAIFSTLLILIGLGIFEIISSVDNVIINADILAKMSPRYRRYFLLFGVLFAVIIIRGILPWLIVYSLQPEIGLWGALSASLTGDKHVEKSIILASPRLFLTGGIFLLFLFLHWLLIETKNQAFYIERVFASLASWYLPIMSVILIVLFSLAFIHNRTLGFAVLVGFLGYVLLYGIRARAGKIEDNLQKESQYSEMSKLFYLLVIDATFSMDGVLGAFAFTLSVPLILIGNGLGAAIIIWFTVHKAQALSKYVYIKNGAMYSIGVLSLIMILEGFGYQFAEWISPVATLLIVVYFFSLSAKK